MRILDVSAGNRAVWFTKKHPDAVYVDIRPEVKPDVVADACALPFKSGCFDMIVFDPPHKNNSGGNMVRSYGHWTHEQIRSTVSGTAAEAHRVAVPDAPMLFKWNDHSVKLDSILRLMSLWWEPLFGHGTTHQQRGTFWVTLRRLQPMPWVSYAAS